DHGRQHHENDEQDERQIRQRDNVDFVQRFARVSLPNIRHKLPVSLLASRIDQDRHFLAQKVVLGHNAPHARRKVVVEESRRNGYTDTDGGRDQSFGDTGCHNGRTAGSGQGKIAESANNAEHRSKQSKQRTDKGEGSKDRKVFIQKSLQLHAIESKNAFHL